MGSLPNLHELGRAEPLGGGGGGVPSGGGGGHPRLGPALSNPHQHHVGQHAALSQEERDRILHRHSTHCRGGARNGRPTEKSSKIIYDDFMLEQMASYSPISSRSNRNLAHSVRRRDSINSSIGANSVRRLIAVVRSTNSRNGPVYSRRILLKNLILLCVTHVLTTATLLPFLALQGSMSVWHQPFDTFPITINIGAFLLTILHLFAAIGVVFGPSLTRRLGTNAVLVVSYLALGLFHLAHLKPILYVLIPLYLVIGLVVGVLNVARVNFTMTIAGKLSYSIGEEDEDIKAARRTCVVRRVARAIQAAQDFGLIFGSVLTAVLITTTINLTTTTTNTPTNSSLNSSVIYVNSSPLSEIYDYSSFLDEIFEVDELGERLCGAQACPSSYQLDSNDFRVLPQSTSLVLVCVYSVMCLLASVIATFCLDKIKLFIYQDPLERSEGMAALRAVRESFKDVKLQLAAPLAVFIGLEQAFMYSDFSKSYVVCTLGVHRLNLVFLCMGLLQSVAACTLSMLLRTIRRYYVLAVGFVFHACLLMVQILWKPMGDDPALFYVISAAWGVCNAVWEMMNFTLLTGLYPDNWEAPFANSLLFRFLGLAVAFGSHGLLCNWLKLYILGCAMLAAVVPFAWLEMRLENIRRVKNVSRL